MSVTADTTAGPPPGTVPHPWNRDFVWALPGGEPTTLSADQKAAFDRDGFVVVPDVVDADTLAAATADLDGLEAAVERYLAAQQDGRASIAESGAITFTVHAVLRSEAARRLVRDPGLVGMTRDLVGPDVNLYWDQAVYKKPERPRRFPWHQDTGYTFVEPQHYLTCWVALTDATVANGCPWVLPGAHRAGTLLHHWVDPMGWECLPADGAEGAAAGAVAAEVPAGGVVVFSSLTPHFTGPNTTDAVRKAYIVQYAPAGMRTVEGDWQGGGEPTGTAPCDDPDRQFPVLRGGQPA
jgi:ectoine hydroxylase-related dioxygenase (phytanoyl-CoA dioxygenase family)